MHYVPQHNLQCALCFVVSHVHFGSHPQLFPLLQPAPIPISPYTASPITSCPIYPAVPHTQPCILLTTAPAHAYFISMEGSDCIPMLYRCSCSQPPCTLRRSRMWPPRSASNLLLWTSRCSASTSTPVSALWLRLVSCSAVAISILLSPFSPQLPFCNGILPWCTSVSSIVCSQHSILMSSPAHLLVKCMQLQAGLHD